MTQRKLGVNIDHVATVRQARGTHYPDPVAAAVLAELAGAHQITVHLREDRRHIQDRDVRMLRETVQTVLNLEMAATPEMVTFARQIKPDIVTLVPEKRQELTTEGGLDVNGHAETLQKVVGDLRDAGIEVSLFVDPDSEQVGTSHRIQANTVELHTGIYCETHGPAQKQAFQKLAEAAQLATELEMRVAAGHGIHYQNVQALVQIAAIEEYNIGHSIVARAIMVGFEQAVRDMLAALKV